MKKLKHILFALAALFVLPCALALVACGKETTANSNACSVIFVVDGHQYKTEEVEKGTVLSEEQLNNLLGITKTGYTFNGWYRDSALTEKYNYSNAINQSIVLFSEYNINKYNLTYVLGNGADDVVVRQDFGTALEHPSNPIREGYTFVGWDKDIPSTMPAEDTTITAGWREFTVEVETNIEGAATLEDYTITNILPNVSDIGGKLNVEIKDVNMGYTFLGWYKGSTLLSQNLKYSHNISDKHTTLVAQFSVNPLLADFEFVSTPESLTITGVKDKTKTELTIPEIATEISQGALAGLANLTKLDIPFVGSAANSALKHPFGHIFSKENPNDTSYVDLSQRDEYYNDEGKVARTLKHYFVPASLKEIVLHNNQTNFGTYVFENFSVLEQLETITYMGTASDWLKIKFDGQNANPMNSNASKFYCLNESGSLELLTTLVVPSTIKEIKTNSLIGFSCLEKVVLPSELKSVLKDAFKGFVAGSIEFYYIGTPEQWQEVNVTSGLGKDETDLTKSGNAVLLAPGAKIYYYAAERPGEEALAANTYWHYDNNTGELLLWE